MTSGLFPRHLARHTLGLALPLVTLGSCGMALADSINIRSGGAATSGITYNDVHIERIDGGQIFYSINGEERNKDVALVATMKLDDESAFNDAEANYQAQKWSDAADGFAKTMSSTDKQWLKDWIAPRLLDAANHANRFDVAMAAWIPIAQKDPAAAAKLKPAIPQGNAAVLDSAAARLGDASRTAKGDSKQVILGLLLDVDNARKDTAGAAAVAQQLQQLSGAPAPSPAGGGAAVAPPPVNPIEGQTKLTLAKTALADKNYDQAIAQIDGAAPVLTDPAQQADALYIRAQALEGKAAAGNDADGWKDAALAYMRVYAHFHDSTVAAQCSGSLLKAAEIEETHLKEPSAALALYQKVAAEYKDKDAAAAQAATAAIARINSGGKQQ